MTRRRPVLIASGFLVALAAAFVVAVVAAAVRPDDPSTAEVEAFQAALIAPARAGGETVERGLKPAVADLTSGSGPAPAVVAEQAVAWRADLVAARRRFAAVRAPEGLADARDRFVAAVDGYVDVASLVREAALAEAADRERLLDQAVAAARAADNLYDRASAALQQARRRVGLPPTPDFPDPP